MPLINNIDGENRLIYLHSDSVGVAIHPIDIYKEMRSLRESDETLRKYDVFLSAFGNVSKGGGTFTERYVVENTGTRIVPFDISQKLTIIGTIITDDGQQGRDCFDRSSLSASVDVDIDYQPPQVEIIQVSVGSGVTEQDKLDIANRVWIYSLRELTAGTKDAEIELILSAITASNLTVIEIRKILKNRQEINNTLKTLIIFDDDGITPLLEYDLKDENDTPSSTNIFKRVPK